MTSTTDTIAGTRPVGNTPANGTHRWATRTFEGGAWHFTTYDGWLIASETTTTDPALAEIITAAIAAITKG